MRIDLRTHVVDALFLALPLALVGGVASYMANIGVFDHLTDSHHVIVRVNDAPLPECAEEDGSSSTLPCVWDGVRGPGHDGNAYRVNTDLSISYLADLARQV